MDYEALYRSRFQVLRLAYERGASPGPGGMPLRGGHAGVGASRPVQSAAWQLERVADGGGPEYRAESCKKNARHAGAEELTEHTAAGPSPEEEVVRREREQELLEALGRLLPEERLLFYRKYYYLQTTARIAAELGMTERAVEGKLYRLKRAAEEDVGG